MFSPIKSGRIVAPEDVHILISGAYGYVTLQGRRDFSDEIKVRVLWQVILIDYQGGLCNHKVLKRWKEAEEKEEK